MRHQRTIALILISISLAPAARAQSPNSRFLPASTKAYMGVPNWSAFHERWKTTQFDRLLNEQGFKGLHDDAKKSGLDGFGLGIGHSELKANAAGEVSWAVVRLGRDAAGQIFLVDAGAQDKGQALLGVASARLQRDGYQAAAQDVSGVNIQVHRLASKDGERLIAMGLNKNIVIITNSIPAIHEVVVRMTAERDNLAGLPAFVETQKQARLRLQDSPDLVWFLEPLGLMDIRRMSGIKSKGKTDLFKVLQREGFDAIKGMGGVVRLGGETDAVAHLAIHAPRPHEKSMKLLSFPPAKDLSPPAWVPVNLAGYVGLSYDVKTGFENIAPIFDAVYGDNEQGTLKDVLKDLRDDPDGPRVDVSKEIIDRLGPRGTVILDTASVPSGGAAVLFAFEAREEKGVAEAVGKLMKDDPEVKRHDFQGAVIWEILERRKLVKGKIQPQSPDHRNKAITVTRGHVLFSDDLRFIMKVLSGAPAALDNQADYRQVADALRKHATGNDSMVVFTRLAEEFQSPYELFRKGQLAGGQLIHGQIFHGVMSMLYPADPAKLPPFEQLSRHMGLAGAVGTTIDDGWIISAVVLKKN